VRNDRPYLADILQALERVQEIGERGRDAFLADWLLQDAAIRNFEIVGEAVKRVSPALQAAHPEIPWADLAGFRDVLVSRDRPRARPRVEAVESGNTCQPVGTSHNVYCVSAGNGWGSVFSRIRNTEPLRD
jgi:hypothetical protein